MGSHVDARPLLSSSELSLHAIDLPGHGKTGQNANLHTLYSYLDNINCPFHLVGYSFGGRIAQKLATHPNALSLTLMSSHTLFSVDELKIRKEFEQKLKDDLQNQEMDTFVANFYSSPLFSSIRRRKRLYESYLMTKSSHKKEDLLFALSEFAIEKILSPLPPIPILGMYGMLDLKYTKLYTQLPKDASVVSVPSSGHVIHMENPSFCIKTLEKFIGQVEDELASKRTL